MRFLCQVVCVYESYSEQNNGEFMSWAEYRTIFALKCGKFATFLAELLVYFGVSIIVFQDMGRTQSNNKVRSYKVQSPYF
jgi:hypothetical protein